MKSLWDGSGSRRGAARPAVTFPVIVTFCVWGAGVSLHAGPGKERTVASGANSPGTPVLVEDHFVDVVASDEGSVVVSVIDGEGFTPGTHGQRGTDIYLANTTRARLVQFRGWGEYEIDGLRLGGEVMNGLVRHTLERGDGIFYCATHSVPAYSARTARQWFFENGRPLFRTAAATAAWMQDQNTLYINALSNAKRDANGEALFCDDFEHSPAGNWWIPLCGALNDYIVHSGIGLDKTLLVGAIDASDSFSGGIRADGVFSQHAIWVESPDGSTSQATPVLAAYATNLAFLNPGWDAVRLKQELLDLAVEEIARYRTGGKDEHGRTRYEERVVKAIRPAFAPRGDPPTGECVPGTETLCLLESRYEVRAEWRTADGGSGQALAAAPRTSDSGLFWFFDSDNWEMLVKVLDGCSINDHVWVFGASTTDLGYTITVRDTVTNRTRRYTNEAGRPAPAITDATAFPGACASSSGLLARSGWGVPGPRSWDRRFGGSGSPSGVGSSSGACAAKDAALCLMDGRCRVTVRWSTLDGTSGAARVASVGTENSGLFYFFDPDNWEMMLKVLDGCSFNGNHWVFAASATDLGLDIEVTDTLTGLTREYTKAPGAPAPAITDVSAFSGACG